jgi:hypothetical protein
MTALSGPETIGSPSTAEGSGTDLAGEAAIVKTRPLGGWVGRHDPPFFVERSIWASHAAAPIGSWPAMSETVVLSTAISPRAIAT